MVDTEIGESKDGKGSGDHDVAYSWGHPRDCLTLMIQARLLVMRGYVKDHTGAIEGDSDWVVPTPSGLFVPAPPKPHIGRYLHDDPETP